MVELLVLLILDLMGFVGRWFVSVLKLAWWMFKIPFYVITFIPRVLLRL